MTELKLDQLLDASFEPEPMDDGFVRSVMESVHAEEQRRWRLKLVRRPVIFGVATAVLAAGGAVAALVGTHAPSHSVAVQTPGAASVTVSAAPPSAGVRAAPPLASSGASPSSSATAGPAGHIGFPSNHTAFVIDDRTGLKLMTETFTNDFHTGKAQRVALTVVNTGSQPIIVSGLNSCGLQVLATPTGGSSMSPVCASGGVTNTDTVLAPGGFYTAHGDLTLPSAGAWNIVGSCTCTYSYPTPTNLTSTTTTTMNSTTDSGTNTIGGLLGKSAPPVLILPQNTPSGGVAKLVTPAIDVDAAR